MIESLSLRHVHEPRRTVVECRFSEAAGRIEEAAFFAGLDSLVALAGERAASFEDLGPSTAARHEALCLLQGCASDELRRALLPAALSAELLERLRGDGALEIELEPDGRGLTQSFSEASHFVPGFAMLYSASYCRSLERWFGPEPRLAQLLEVAQLFFLSEYSLSKEDEVLGGLEGQVPSEALNSFVNFIHPHPDHAGNLLRRILLIEDNRTLAEILGDMLSSFGYVVCPVYDGVAGLARLEQEPFDLVLSDIQMPRLDGLGFVKMLGELRLELPVILMTGYTGIWDREQVLKKGAVDFLPKPFAMEDLLAAVSRALVRKPA